MKIQFVLQWCFCLAFTVTSFQHVKGETNVKVEIIQPFPAWFLTEKVDFFVQVSNIGNKAIRVASTAQKDLFFEIAPKVTTLGGDFLNLPKVENAGRTEPKGLLLPPGKAYTLSDADFNEADLVNSECFTRVRVHLLVEQGRWVSSEWTERKILPAPDLNVASLHDYKLSAFSSSTHSVILLRVDGEDWLFSHVKGTKAVGRRLCRVPDGILPTSFEHDLEARRLTIRFAGNEEPLVINTRTGLPLSGSERTVPHLHLWLQLAGRPFTDSYQEAIEQKEGSTNTHRLRMTTVPVVTKGVVNGEVGQESRAAGIPPRKATVGKIEDASRDEAIGRRSWVWVTVGLTLFIGFMGFWLAKRKS